MELITLMMALCHDSADPLGQFDRTEPLLMLLKRTGSQFFQSVLKQLGAHNVSEDEIYIMTMII